MAQFSLLGLLLPNYLRQFGLVFFLLSFFATKGLYSDTVNGESASTILMKIDGSLNTSPNHTQTDTLKTGHRQKREERTRNELAVN